MRTTVDIDEKLLDEALKLSKIRTKKELINLSLREYVRKIRLENLKNRLGNYDLAMDLKDIEESRKYE